MMIKIEEIEWWTFELVREALVEAMALWMRSPGEGRWPFAADGPWHLMMRDAMAGDYDARGGLDQQVEVEPRPLPLSRAEVAHRDRVSEWLGLVPKADDRRLIAIASTYYARGSKQVPWKAVKHRMGIERGEGGLRQRYNRAVGSIAKALNDMGEKARV